MPRSLETFLKPTPSQNPFETEWVLALKPSVFVWVLTVVIHTLALYVLWQLSFPFWLVALISLSVLLSCWYYLFRHGLYRHPQQLAAIKWREFGGWELLTCAGQSYNAVLLNNSYAGRWLTVLNFKTNARHWLWRRYTVILTPENLNTKQGSHLRRRLNLVY